MARGAFTPQVEVANNINRRAFKRDHLGTGSSSKNLDELTVVMAALEGFCDDAGVDMGAAQAAELALDKFLNNIISCSPSTVEILTCQVSTSLRAGQ